MAEIEMKSWHPEVGIGDAWHEAEPKLIDGVITQHPVAWTGVVYERGYDWFKAKSESGCRRMFGPQGANHLCRVNQCPDAAPHQAIRSAGDPAKRLQVTCALMGFNNTAAAAFTAGLLIGIESAYKSPLASAAFVDWMCEQKPDSILDEAKELLAGTNTLIPIVMGMAAE